MHRIDELDGIGRRMPWTTVAFTIGALGMIGVPPTAGFVSKVHLGAGALAAGQGWVLGVLMLSSLLNAMYFLPILHRVWFRPARGPWPGANGHAPRAGGDAAPMLLLPLLITGASALGAGVLAGLAWSPLDWSARIVRLEWGYGSD